MVGHTVGHDARRGVARLELNRGVTRPPGVRGAAAPAAQEAAKPLRAAVLVLARRNGELSAGGLRQAIAGPGRGCC